MSKGVIRVELTFPGVEGYDPNALSPEAIAGVADAIRAALVGATTEERAGFPWHLVDIVVAKFYEMPENGAGGLLHIVLDDSNLDDRSIEWCIGEATKVADVAAVAVGRMLLVMTYEERAARDFVCPCCRGSTT